MKLPLLSLTLLLSLIVHAGAVGSEKATPTTVTLDRATLEAELGRKLTFKERIGFRIVNKQLKKQAKRADKRAKGKAGGKNGEVNKRMAVLAFIFGLVGITLGAIVPFVFLLVIPGLILGIIALNRANQYPDEYGGRGLAIAGIVLSGIGVLLMFIALVGYVN
jgi:ABC-type dipeptide/oligopeptide/nickel transport system permease component